MNKDSDIEFVEGTIEFVEGTKETKSDVQVVVSPTGTIACFPDTPLDLLFVTASGKEFMRVSPDGKIKFNRKDNPDWEADDFAKEFMDILEYHWTSKCT